MNKVLSILSRSLLVLGVIIALTPCQICKGAAAPKSQCSMPMGAKGDCCHPTKSNSPACMAMDQSVVKCAVPSAPISTHSVLAVKVFSASVFRLASFHSPTALNQVNFRGPTVLRI